MSTGTVSSSGDVHAHVAALHGQQVAKEVAAAATTSAAGGGVPTFDLWDMSVPAVALTWALDDWSLPSAADAVVIAEAAADALAERLTRVLCDVLGKSPAEAAVHLAWLGCVQACLPSPHAWSASTSHYSRAGALPGLAFSLPSRVATFRSAPRVPLPRSCSRGAAFPRLALPCC